MTMLRAGRPRICVSIPGRGKSFSLLQSIQTGFETDAVSYSVSTGVSFSGVKRPGREANLSHPSNAKVRMGMTVHSQPAHAFMAWQIL
jgi:hypothetical protein